MMTINDQILHLIKTQGPLASAQLYDLADLVESRKQLGNSLNRLKRRALIERGADGLYRITHDTPDHADEPDPDDPLSDGDDAAQPAPQPEPDPEPAPAPDPEPAPAPDPEPAPAPAPAAIDWRDLHSKTQTVLDQLLRDDSIEALLNCVIDIRDMALKNMLNPEQ